jgi:hypothetical protein
LGVGGGDRPSTGLPPECGRRGSNSHGLFVRRLLRPVRLPYSATPASGSVPAAVVTTDSDPFVGDLFSFQGAIWARTTKPIEVFGRATLAGARGIEPRPGRLWRPLGYQRLTPRLSSAAVSGPKNKGAASWWKRLLDGLRTFKSPGHPVRGASISRLADLMASLAYPCVDTDSQLRDAAGVCTPPKCRASRLFVTSLHHMVNNIHRFDDALKEEMSLLL